MKTFVCMCQPTDYIHVDEQRFCFLWLKCFTHTQKEGAWNEGAHLCLHTNFSGCLNTNNSCVLFLFWVAGKILVCLDVMSIWTLSLNHYLASRWCNRKCLQSYIKLAIWQKGDFKSWTQRLVCLLSCIISVTLCCKSVLPYRADALQEFYWVGLIISRTRVVIIY